MSDPVDGMWRVACHGRGQGGRIIHVVIGRRGDEGLMRAQIGEMGSPKVPYYAPKRDPKVP